jgi:aspartate/methionine/tyrosine aminotransferase
MVKIYDKRRCFIHASLNAIDGVTCLKPESTFYAFANITATGLSSWEFAKCAARKYKVAVVPGSVFGKCGEGYIRLSFAAGMEQLEEGAARLSRCVADVI